MGSPSRTAVNSMSRENPASCGGEGGGGGGGGEGSEGERGGGDGGGESGAWPEFT